MFSSNFLIVAIKELKDNQNEKRKCKNDEREREVLKERRGKRGRKSKAKERTKESTEFVEEFAS
jgi:hypothetical protein